MNRIPTLASLAFLALLAAPFQAPAAKAAKAPAAVVDVCYFSVTGMSLDSIANQR